MTITPACTLQTTKLWFERARANPTPQHFLAQLGVHYEEVAESLDELVSTRPTTQTLIDEAQLALERLAAHLKSESAATNVSIVSDENFLDALCDQIVTATGVAHTLSYDIVGAMTEVNRSNFSKFDENGQPLFDENKKVIKGPNYSKAVLLPYLPE